MKKKKKIEYIQELITGGKTNKNDGKNIIEKLNEIIKSLQNKKRK